MMKSKYDKERKIIEEHWKIMRYEIFQLLNIQLDESSRLRKLTDLFYLSGEHELEIEKFEKTDWKSIEDRMNEIEKIINV